MGEDLLELGSREPSGFISVGLICENSCFPTISSKSTSLDDFAMRSKRTNSEFVAFKLITSDDDFRETVLHPLLQLKYFNLGILSHIFLSPWILSSTKVVRALLPRSSIFNMSSFTCSGIICFVVRLTSFISEPSSFSDVLNGLACTTTSFNCFIACSWWVLLARDIWWVRFCSTVGDIKHVFSLSSEPCESGELRQYFSKACGSVIIPLMASMITVVHFVDMLLCLINPYGCEWNGICVNSKFAILELLLYLWMTGLKLIHLGNVFWNILCIVMPVEGNEVDTHLRKQDARPSGDYVYLE